MVLRNDCIFTVVFFIILSMGIVIALGRVAGVLLASRSEITL